IPRAVTTDPEAELLLRKVRAKYANSTSYQDSGSISEIGHGEASAFDGATFFTVFERRSGKIRFDFSDSRGRVASMSGTGSGLLHVRFSEEAGVRVLPADLAIATLTGISLGVVEIVPAE